VRFGHSVRDEASYTQYRHLRATYDRSVEAIIVLSGLYSAQDRRDSSSEAGKSELRPKLARALHRWLQPQLHIAMLRSVLLK